MTYICVFKSSQITLTIILDRARAKIYEPDVTEPVEADQRPNI